MFKSVISNYLKSLILFGKREGFWIIAVIVEKCCNLGQKYFVRYWKMANFVTKLHDEKFNKQNNLITN